MVAIASLPTTATSARAGRATVAPRLVPGARRPALTLVPTAAASPRTAVGSVVAAALLALAVLLAVGYLVTTPLVAPGNATAGTHLVADGETMWSIAVEHAPAGQAAGYVEQLVAANGGATVTAGQELMLPTP